MMSVLLLTFTVSTVFVSSGYQKAYAAEDFPTSDLSPKIREWINNQMREDLFAPSSSIPVSSIKITLSDFPHQTGESVTNVGLRCSPLTVAGNVCTGADNIVIPGIGEVTVYGIILSLEGREEEGQPLSLFIDYFSSIININTIISVNGAVTRTIYIPGIGSGQATIQLS